MNKYNWDLNYLIKKREKLEKKLVYLENDLSTYNALIASFDKRITNSNCSFKDELDGIDYEINPQTFVNEILPHTNLEALEMLLQAKNILTNYNWPKEIQQYTPCYLNNKELVEYTISLISKIPHKQFVNSIKSCTISKKHLLHIKHHSKLSTECYGLSLFDLSQKRPYGLVSRNNNTNDIVTLAHELFHMVVKKEIDPRTVIFSNSIYDEIEGYLANFIIGDLLKMDNYSEKEIDFIDCQDLWKTGWDVHDSFVTVTILNHMDENYKFPLGVVNKYLKEEGFKIKITKENMNTFFYSSFNEGLNYGFSYLAALDLYNLYKIDPEKAINHLYSIKNFTGEEIEKELENIDCTFHKDGYQNLDNKCKQLLNKKTTKKVK